MTGRRGRRMSSRSRGRSGAIEDQGQSRCHSSGESDTYPGGASMGSCFTNLIPSNGSVSVIVWAPLKTLTQTALPPVYEHENTLPESD
jgi:hypothetical protein